MSVRQAGENSLPATPLVGVVPALVPYRSAQAREPRGQAPVAGKILSPAFLRLGVIHSGRLRVVGLEWEGVR